MDGWIKIHRSILKWEWYDDANTFRLFIHLLLTANYENKKWRGMRIKRGQLVTSVADLGKSIGLSPQCIRTSLLRLKSTNEITSKTTNHFTIITICNYEHYQDIKLTFNKQNIKLSNKPITNKQQTTNKQLTTTKERKEIKNMKKERNIDISFVSEEFLVVWNKWIEYRNLIRKPFRTYNGMVKKYNELIQLSGNDPARALLIVQQSIDEEWQGLFPLKQGSHSLVPEDPVDKGIREMQEARRALQTVKPT